MKIVIIATAENNSKISDSATWDCEAAVRETLEKHGVDVSNMNSRKEGGPLFSFDKPQVEE